MLQSVGARTETWGTQLGKFLVCDDLPLNDARDCLPPTQMASHLLVLLCMFVLYSSSVSVCQGMASKALLMSIKDFGSVKRQFKQISIVSVNGMLVNQFSTSNEAIKKR